MCGFQCRGALVSCLACHKLLVVLVHQHALDLSVQLLDILQQGLSAGFLLLQCVGELVDSVLQDLGCERQERDQVLVGHLQVFITLSSDHCWKHLLQLLGDETVAAVLSLGPVLEIEGHGAELSEHPTDRIGTFLAWGPRRGCGRLLPRTSSERGGRCSAGSLRPPLRRHALGDRAVERDDGALQPPVTAGHSNVGCPRAVENSTEGSDCDTSDAIDLHLVLRIRASRRVLEVRVRVADVHRFSINGQRGPKPHKASQGNRAAELRVVEDRHFGSHAGKASDRK
mmetsp:Transcript_120685/g.386347  ORF Transcript_120685/g.386347 Transcript_120685/m.386347 type:complete len:284 (+) Transcript_120685:308-1159(+)